MYFEIKKINLYRLQQRELPFLAKIEYSNKKKTIFTAYKKESWHFLQKLDTEIKNKNKLYRLRERELLLLKVFEKMFTLS